MTNTLNQDKLIKYIPRSNPEKSILIPLKHADRAKKIQSFALESKSMNEFYNHVILCSSLKDVYIPDKTVSFVLSKNTRSEKELKLYDEIYLETCLHLMQDDLSRNNVHHEDFYIHGDEIRKKVEDEIREKYGDESKEDYWDKIMEKYGDESKEKVENEIKEKRLGVLVEIGRIRSNVASYGEFPVQESGLERLQKIRSIENIKKTLESL
jgi:hypothetical protein